MTQRHWGRGLRVRGRIDSIPEVRIWPFLIGLMAVSMAIVLVASVATAGMH